MSINTHTNKSKSILHLRHRPILHLSFIIFLLFVVPKSVAPIPETTSLKLRLAGASEIALMSGQDPSAR
ncbi:unnamed protein product [Coffea canephora]|uniref:DH200=94 genomic scaffold, scaffold_261 n=1 Tax=Coffea canephora TaxID=49390 RepID=A0A068VG14_COFCA|nr:unnamed protein product [Coffea canephora]